MADALPTLLVVDDEPPLLRLLVRALELEGYRVLPADDGTRALELYAAHADEIDAVILDVIIPPKGGGDVLEALWARDPDLPVLVTSGDSPGHELQERLAQGRGAFVRKPFDPVDLLREIEVLREPRSKQPG